MGGMSGGEGGVVNEETLQNILEINRDSALRIAAEKRDRMTSVFRRSRVFERTFQRELYLALDETGTSVFAVTRAPEGYFEACARIYDSQVTGFHGAEM